MLSKKILLMRQRMQVTQAELGEILGVGAKQIGHYETGQRKPSIRVTHLLMALAERVKVKISLKDFLPTT